jgi:hypothetical protein
MAKIGGHGVHARSFWHGDRAAARCAQLLAVQPERYAGGGNGRPQRSRALSASAAAGAFFLEIASD